MKANSLVEIVILKNGRDFDIPRYATSGSAGFDLRAAISTPVTLSTGSRYVCPTGLKMAIPVGFEGQVRPRSGLAARHGITVLNSPGTVDCDYRGEVKVILINHGEEAFIIERGMRIAQMVIAPCLQADLMIVSVLSGETTGRGTRGFGSTGIT